MACHLAQLIYLDAVLLGQICCPIRLIAPETNVNFAHFYELIRLDQKMNK